MQLIHIFLYFHITETELHLPKKPFFIHSGMKHVYLATAKRSRPTHPSERRLPLEPAARACRPGSLASPFSLFMLRYDNVAVRYITAAHGVHHSGRHFMLHNHPICISLCIKVLVHGLVKSALPHYQKIAAEGKNALKEL